MEVTGMAYTVTSYETQFLFRSVCVCVHIELGGTCEFTNTSIYTPVPSNDREDQLLQLWTEFNSISGSSNTTARA